MNYPWLKTLRRIKTRCHPNAEYGKRGIKCFITAEELKILWFRDKAWRLKQPSIDRARGRHYSFKNCRYIELKDNIINGLIGNNNTKGKKTQTEESKKKISEAAKKMWSDPVWKKRFLAKRTGMKYKLTGKYRKESK